MNTQQEILCWHSCSGSQMLAWTCLPHPTSTHLGDPWTVGFSNHFLNKPRPAASTNSSNSEIQSFVACSSNKCFQTVEAQAVQMLHCLQLPFFVCFPLKMQQAETRSVMHSDIHALKFLQRYSMTVALNQMKISSLRKIKTTHTTCSKRPACQQQPSQRQGEQISPVGPKQPAVPLLRGLPTHLQGVSFTSQKNTPLTALLSTVKHGRHSKILFYFPAAASPIQLAASYHLQRSVAFFGDGRRAPETPLYIKVTSLLHSEDEL